MKNGFAKYHLCAYEDEMFSVFNRVNNTLWQGIEKGALERLNLNGNHEIKPQEIMIVGESVSSDMMGGIEFGIKICFYNSGKKCILNGIKVDYEIA